MIKIDNLWIEVTKDSPCYTSLSTSLVYEEKVRTRQGRGRNAPVIFTKRQFPLYTKDKKTESLLIPVGLYDFISNQFVLDKVVDTRSINKFKVDSTIDTIDVYADVLGHGITLRKEQLIAIRKILFAKRCLVQMCTGCFVGHTRVLLTDGTSMKFIDLINDYKDKKVYTYSYKYNKVVESNIKSVHISKYTDYIVRINFDNGISIECTPHHPFMVHDNGYLEAKYLEPDTKLEIYGSKKVSVKHVSHIRLHTKIPVYDLEVDNDSHNFAIDVSYSDSYGVFVHNSGKSEVMCGTVKLLSSSNNGVYPTTLVIEPTSRLVNEMTTRFAKYDIPVTKYGSNRKVVPNTVNICHPKSLGNDIENDSTLLNDVEVMFGDECHHLRSPSFRKPTYYMPNLVYSVGLSASAIAQDHIGAKSLKDYTYGEALTIGATGPLVLNIKTEQMIKNGSLAVPVLVVLNNSANEATHTADVTDWHAVSKYRLESDDRNKLVVDAARFFYEMNRKTLILVNTRRWAYKLMELFDSYKMSDSVRASFGGGVFERYNGHDFEVDTNNVNERFNRGEISILIGTSHIYEGADIPNLDSVILAYGGRGERLQIQGIGRALRKTKTGKYAWLVDFNDLDDVVLHSQFKKRFQRYKELIGVKEDKILDGVDIQDMRNAFYDFENIHQDVYEVIERYLKGNK